jgi:serine/threonine-protein kinase
MTDPLRDQLADALADRYLLEEELGRGASAVVYLVHDLRHSRRVALKVLHAHLGQALGIKRFQREIRTQARLHHPHILPVFDSGQVVVPGAPESGGPASATTFLYYVMPAVESGSLKERLERHGPMSVHAMLQLAREVASALSYAHALGVIHRDLKPANILVSARGHALLTDFGIAYALDETGPWSGRHLTETGVTLGTPAYMSPEQSAGDETDMRSDQYSLGVVLYEALAGRPPFEGANARAIMARRLTEEPPPMRSARPDVPPPVERVILRALARQPNDRFESVDAFGQALAAAEQSAAPASGAPAVSGAAAAASSGPASASMSSGIAGAPATARGWSQLRTRWVLVAAMAAVLAIGVGAGMWLTRRRPARSPAGPRVIAVLPFKNLGAPADQYFADGLTEEITSRLAGLSGLRVISRTSADQYRTSTQSVPTIGAELGADYVLEGSVRWAKAAGGPGRLRVTPQLIAVGDDSHLWAGTYESELGEVFQLQSAIAEQVTTALDVALRAPERAALAAGGTRSSEAYDLYLKGVDYQGRTYQEDDLRNAVRMFEQAVTIDPKFAQAYARLSRAHAQIYWHFYDRTDARLRQAKQAADAAAALAPHLPDTHVALGFYYYWGELDYGSALREFELARRQQPSNSELLGAIGYVERRRGQWQESLARLVEALRYDPRSARRTFDVADVYFMLHMYPEANHYFDRTILLSPDWGTPYIYKAWMLVSWRGDLTEARRVLREGMGRVEAGHFAPGLAAGDRVSASLVTADSGFARWLNDLSVSVFSGDTARYHVLKAEAGYLQGHRDAARGHADSALAVLEPRVRIRPDDAKLLELTSRAYSYAGRHDDAIRAVERAARELPLERDGVSGPYIQSSLARAYMEAGRPDPAIAILERLLRIPGWITPAELRADPIWDPLRGHPRFRAISAEAAPAG